MPRTRFRKLFIAIGGLCLAMGVAAWILLTPAFPPGRPDARFLPGAEIPPATKAILERSCGDCHSDRTSYPWYSYVPGVSYAILDDVIRGREQLNFSHWDRYSRLKRQRALTGVANQVKDRAMPLPRYLWLHPAAKLTPQEIDAVFAWAQEERLRLILMGASSPELR